MPANGQTRLGLGSYAFAWSIGVPGYPPQEPMDAFALLDCAAELGVTLVQISDNLPLHELEPAVLAGLAREARRREIDLEVGTRGISPQVLQRYLAIAIELGSPLLRVVVDTAEHHPSPAEVVQALGSVLPDFEGAGVTLAIENHDRFEAAVLRDIVFRLGSSRAGICLDTANSLGCLEGPRQVLAVLGPQVVNLHVKDFRIRRQSHNMGFTVTGTPAGQGMLDIPQLLSELRSHGRCPSAILEQWPPPEATLEATIRKERQWAAQSVAYLGGVLGTGD